MRCRFRFFIVVLLIFCLLATSCEAAPASKLTARYKQTTIKTTTARQVTLSLPPEPRFPGESQRQTGIAGRAFYAELGQLGYADPGNVFTISNDSLSKEETLLLSVNEAFIYKYYYISINGKWEKFTFPQQSIGNSSWIAFAAGASVSTEQLPPGDNYVIAYSCSKTNSGFDCHNNKWQIHAFQILPLPNLNPQCGSDVECPLNFACVNSQCVPNPLPPQCSPSPSQNELVPAVTSPILQKPVTKQAYIDYLMRQPYPNNKFGFHEWGWSGPNKNIYLNGGVTGEYSGPEWGLQGLALAKYYQETNQPEKAKAYFQKVKYFLLGPGPWNNWDGTGDKNYVNNQFKQAFDRAIQDTGGNGSLPIRRCWFVGINKDNSPIAKTAKGWAYQNCTDFTQNDLNTWATQNGLQNPKMIKLEYKNPKGGYHVFLKQPEQIELEMRGLEEAAKTDSSILTDEERALLKDMIFNVNKRIRVWGYGEEVNSYEQLSAIYQYDPAKYPKPTVLPPRKEYWRGNHHRSQDEAMMKRLGAWRILNDNTATDEEKKQAQIWLNYSNLVWNDWWSVRDTAFDQTSFTILDWLYYVMLGAHILDGQDPAMTLFWNEAGASMKPFWDRYLNTITPDGFAFPLSIHDGFIEGDPTLLWMMELLAAETKDGRYKWIAHRIMNNILYQESQGKLSPTNNGQWSYYDSNMALAYLFADDSVKEVEPNYQSQSANGKKVFWMAPDKNGDPKRDLAAKYFGGYDNDLYKNYNDPNSPNYDHGYVDAGFVVLPNQTAPSKFFFKSGNRPGDFTVMVETAARDGNPHNPGGIAGVASHVSLLAMSQSPKTFTSFQNMLSVEDPSKTVTMIKNDNPDANIWQDRCYMESEAPTFTDYKLATHARLKTDNYLCFPMSNEREFFFVKNRFMVVRDRATSHFEKPFNGILKEIWYTETIGSKGQNWADTYIEKPLYKDIPMANPSWNLLVYHSSKEGRVLSSGPAPAWLNWLPGIPPSMPQTVTYDQAKTVAPETPEVFTYLLLPHDPTEKAENLASSINVLVDTLDQTVIRFGSTENPSEWVVLNEKGAAIKQVGLETDAKQLYLQIKDGKVARILAVEASYVILEGKDLFKKDKRITVDGILPTPECL